MESKELLKRLGASESIEALCQAAGWSRAQFDRWWQEEAAQRAPGGPRYIPAAVQAEVAIERDGYGIPHIFSEDCRDLWFGFGYVMAQDRLFQMDYLRR